MKRGLARAAIVTIAMAACGAAPGERERKGASAMDGRELIVLAAPKAGDAYYAGALRGIIDFHVAYAKSVAKQDDVIVLTDAALYDDYAAAIGAAHVAIAPMADIWMRDFSLPNAAAPVMFRYTAAGQGGDQQEADAVQEDLADLIDKAGLAFTESDLLNDGGNWVDDGHGNAVVSRKFLTDNRLDETAARAALVKLTGARHIAFIDADDQDGDEQGGLEHADGVVAFIERGKLVINAYPDDPDYAAALRADLTRALPGVVLYEIVTPYDGSNIHDVRFGSACGLYTNMLVTPNRIYFPQFGIPEDAKALAQISSWTDRTVIPVRSDQVCRMGGGVRCLSWQLRGANAAKLRSFLKKQR